MTRLTKQRQFYFKCEHCGDFTPVGKRPAATLYCSKSCQSKAYYQRKKRRSPRAAA